MSIKPFASNKTHSNARKRTYNRKIYDTVSDDDLLWKHEFAIELDVWLINMGLICTFNRRYKLRLSKAFDICRSNQTYPEKTKE